MVDDKVYQVLMGLGTLGGSIGIGIAAVVKIIAPLIAKKSNGNGSNGNGYVPLSVCKIRHEAEIKRHDEVKDELSKLFDKNDETQKGIAQIEGILKGIAQAQKTKGE